MKKPRHRPGGGYRFYDNGALLSALETEMVEHYKRHRTFASTAEHFGVHPKTVKRLAEKAGLPNYGAKGYSR